MSFSLAQIAKNIDAQLQVADGSLQAVGVAPLDSASDREISFLSSDEYIDDLKTSKALAVVLKPEQASLYVGNKLLMNDPYLGFARMANMFYQSPPVPAHIHESAVVAASAQIDREVFIGPQVSVANNVVLAKGVEIGAGCVIGENCQIGKNTKLVANVTVLAGTIIGQDCILHAGAVIGDDGFGYAKDNGRWLKIPQTGKVIIGDRVEIGSSTTIDRGALGNTIIADGVKLDNQIQIGHNVVIGENSALAGCVGVAGSAVIGKNCMIAGMVGISGHLEIVDGCQIMAQSMVTKSIIKPGIYSSGWAAESVYDWRKKVGRFKRLEFLHKRIKKLEERFKQ